MILTQNIEIDKEFSRQHNKGIYMSIFLYSEKLDFNNNVDSSILKQQI